MAHINYPLLGDPVYGGRARVPAGINETLLSLLQGFKRQALHAARLAFVHPASDAAVEFEVPPPEDFQALLGVLRSVAAQQ